LKLENGKNYFLRAEGESVAFQNVVGGRKGRLEMVTCEVAHAETQKYHVMEEKQLGTAYKSLAESDMPACSVTP
jgi:hypothetical protein